MKTAYKTSLSSIQNQEKFFGLLAIFKNVFTRHELHFFGMVHQQLKVLGWKTVEKRVFDFGLGSRFLVCHGFNHTIGMFDGIFFQRHSF